MDVVIVDNKNPDRSTEKRILKSVGATVHQKNVRSSSDVITAAEGADGVIVSAGVPLDREFFEAVPSIQVVGRAGIGVDNIDLSAARENGIKVLHVPEYCIEEVSTHALSLTLACGRRLPIYNAEVRSGSWDWKDGRPITRATEWTLGLVAFGSIARRVAEKASCFGIDVLAHDPYVERSEMEEWGVEKVDFEELLDRSTAVSVHTPLTPETRGLFDDRAFDRMDRNATIINTARGPVIDEDALYHALITEEIGVAGLDVMVEEPTYDSKLYELDSVIVTPHTAWYSEEAQDELSRNIAEDVGRVLSGEEPENEVQYGAEWI